MTSFYMLKCLWYAAWNIDKLISPFDCLDEPAAANMLERVQDMYMAILESEECIERVVCELGGLVEDAGYSKQMTK